MGSGPERPAAARAGLDPRVRAPFADSVIAGDAGSNGPERPASAPVGPERTVTGTVTDSAPAAARLLTIYFRRFESNLVGAFRQLLDDPGSVATGKEAMELAEGLGALIDGLYIREALGAREPDAYRAIELCRRHVDAALGRIGIESGLAARIKASRSGQPGHGSPATGGVH